MNPASPIPNPSDQARTLRIQAWVDGELSPAEAQQVEREISTDPAARALVDQLHQVQDFMRDGESPRIVEASRDFYWSQIVRGIEREQRETERHGSVAARRRPKMLRWLLWMVPAGGAAAVLALMLRSPDTETRITAVAEPPVPIRHEVDAPTPEMTTLTFYSERDAATVVWVSHADVL